MPEVDPDLETVRDSVSQLLSDIAQHAHAEARLAVEQARNAFNSLTACAYATSYRDLIESVNLKLGESQTLLNSASYTDCLSVRKSALQLSKIASDIRLLDPPYKELTSLHQGLAESELRGSGTLRRYGKFANKISNVLFCLIYFLPSVCGLLNAWTVNDDRFPRILLFFASSMWPFAILSYIDTRVPSPRLTALGDGALVGLILSGAICLVLYVTLKKVAAAEAGLQSARQAVAEAKRRITAQREPITKRLSQIN